MKNSIWLEGILENKTIPNISNKKTDILIIGGGLAGMSTALSLKDSQKKVMLIDKGTIGFGVTGHTTGKITYLQECVYQKITKHSGIENAHLYYESQKEAHDLIKQNIDTYHINCDYECVPSFVISKSEKEKEKEKEILSSFGVSFIKSKWKYGFGVSDTAVFHPIKYLYGIKNIVEKYVSIYENVIAHKVEKKENKYLIMTNVGVIEAHTLILANHYPFFIYPGWIPLKSHTETSYIIGTPHPNQKFSLITSGTPMYSVRFHQDYLLYGSTSHNTVNQVDSIQNKQNMEKEFHKFLNTPIQYEWSNQDVVTTDSIPYIGALDNQLYIATGFNTWGMTNGVLAGKVLADLIENGGSRYETLLSPKRKIGMHRLASSFLNTCGYGKAYLQTILIKNHSFYPDNVKVVREDGKWIGIYIDENGKEHKVLNQCPHMKCGLIFNDLEHTWDCPCHSSRFTIDGDLIKGPSGFSIRIDCDHLDNKDS